MVLIIATISTEIENEMNIVRERIAHLDKEIVTILSERMLLSKKIGIIKSSKNLPIRNVSVESEVIARVKNTAKMNDISEDLIENVYRLIIKESIQIQEQLLLHSEIAIEKTGNDLNKEKCLIIGGLGKRDHFLVNYLLNKSLTCILLIKSHQQKILPLRRYQIQLMSMIS